jgi:multiple sugar transport system permease protein
MTGIPFHGTYWGIIFVYSAFFLPFSVWILRSFFAAIPVALEEAATIDGCNAFQVFTRISLPLAVPGVIATGIFVFLVAWDELMFAWILTNAKTMTVPVGIRLFVGNFQNRFDLMMAAATVATLPVMIIFFLLQRHIVSGLTAGAVKE